MAMSAWADASAALLLLAAASFPNANAQTAAAKTHVVTIENVTFSPQLLTVRRGDRVVWVNKDLFPHTATAEAGAFDSREIAPQAYWTHVARKPGEYAYFCTYHPTMKAKIIVR